MPEDVIQHTVHTASHIHLTGIKGVGMTATALCLQDLGKQVSGSDLADDFVTQEILAQRQIVPQIGFDPSHLPPETDLLIYTGAHQGQHNPEVVAAVKKGIRTISHAESVGELMRQKIGISVCGVGGKTSTSAIIANILDYSGLKPSFLIGVGKVLNLQVPGRMSPGEHFIAEADEYALSPGIDNTPRFTFQTPQYIVCTNVAHDHPDVYPTIEDTKLAFSRFFNQLPDTGKLVLNGNSGPLRQILTSGKSIIWYGVSPVGNDWWIDQTLIGEGKQLVRILNKKGESFQYSLSVPGTFNALNALAAFIISQELGIDPKKAIEAIQLFRGSMRRFEKVGDYKGSPLYDDYAHHPSQIFATLQAARQWLPLYKIVCVFQPHTYSRTRVLLEQFAKSFTYADKVIITDIYASAREAPDASTSGYTLAQSVKQHHPNVDYIPQNQLVEELKRTLTAQDALFTLGAGDIASLHRDLLATA